MEELQAIRALAALAHESRLRIFRLLTRHGTAGLAAGKIAEQLGLPAATLSFHIKELSNAGLVLDRRDGRSVIYSLNAAGMQTFLSFLLDDCCGGQPELCGPLYQLQPKRRKKAAVQES
jgi:ArsR family transcriptional regulator